MQTPDSAPAKKGKPLFTKEETPKATSALFDSPDSDSEDMFKKVVTGDLFGKDDGLFGTRKAVTAPPALLKKTETIDIFNDDGDDLEDVFSAKKLPPKSDLIKKSLFDDDLDDDDIFGAGSSKIAHTTMTGSFRFV